VDSLQLSDSGSVIVVMPRVSSLQNISTAISHPRRKQRGYMLLTLTLALAMLTIALLTVLPDMTQQIRRDREEEMIHRGTAYMRAIQHFYRMFGRYPSRIEDLENTNNRRFLRKRYTDPLNRDPATGKEKDFKLLYQTDILGQTSGLNGLGGQGGVPPQSGRQGQGGFSGAASGDQAAASSDSGDSSSGSSGNASDAVGNSSSFGSSSSNSNTGSNPGAALNLPTGGGAIAGVASASKARAIREFYNKTHYKDWLFIYLPQDDRGGLLKGPVNPGLPTPNLNGGAFGQPPGTGGTGQGSSGTGPLN
jgi:type II secretory pathway pseudopilin PulG